MRRLHLPDGGPILVRMDDTPRHKLPADWYPPMTREASNSASLGIGGAHQGHPQFLPGDADGADISFRSHHAVARAYVPGAATPGLCKFEPSVFGAATFSPPCLLSHSAQCGHQLP